MDGGKINTGLQLYGLYFIYIFTYTFLLLAEINLNSWDFNASPQRMQLWDKHFHIYFNVWLKKKMKRCFLYLDVSDGLQDQSPKQKLNYLFSPS